MTTFLITPSSEALARHVAFLRQIGDAGKLYMAGKYKDNTGGLRIWKVSNLDEAQKLAKDDPYSIEGIGRSEFKEWFPSFNYSSEIPTDATIPNNK
ncbi:MAG: hypothetical protein JRN15_16980 [Nitrososphaerota archaeon]|nr:hypothetical protein [Nitrososphaerota archaeon]